jgi:hypothetical protein
MLTKRYLTISLLLPLLAISATAHAGSTITDKSYWPSAARPAVHSEGAMAHGGPRDAFASSATAPIHGGPKFQATHPGGR